MTQSNADSRRAPEAAPLVSVVIPTVGRPALHAAIASVRGQQPAVPLEVVLVVDGPEDARTSSVLDADRVLFTGGGRGAAHARNLGTRAAKGKYVAYLDDDDVWLSDKLHQQLRLLADEPKITVASSRYAYMAASGEAEPGQSLPRDLCTGDPAEYLFLGRRPELHRNAIHTSTLVLPRRLAVDVGWDEKLRRHQDWDFVLRCARDGNARVRHAPGTTVVIKRDSGGSISAGSDWRASLVFYDKWYSDWAPQVRSDFLTAQVLRYAIQARDRAGVNEVLGRLRETRRLPNWGPVVIGSGGLVRRDVAFAIAARLKRR